jgi:guanylate kinase
VQSALKSGRDAVLKIDVQGAHKVREKVPDVLLIYVVPPSFEVLRERLLGRSTETSAELEVRLRNAEYELAQQSEYDHVVVNETDQIDTTAELIDAVIAAEHERAADRRILV